MPTRAEIDHFLLHTRALENDANAPSDARRQAKLVADEFAAATPNGQSPLLFLTARMALVVGGDRPDADVIEAIITTLTTRGRTSALDFVLEIEG